MTIAQISDLHVGPTIKKGYVENVVAKISQVNPDMIVITGDLIDGSIKHLRNDLAPLADLSASCGVYFVTGNHEYYSGVDYCVEHIDKLGITNLINEHIVINKNKDNIILAGITDYRAEYIKPSHRSNPSLALDGASKDLTSESFSLIGLILSMMFTRQELIYKFLVTLMAGNFGPLISPQVLRMHT